MNIPILPGVYNKHESTDELLEKLYPIIPPIYNIQKHLLNINTIPDEINYIKWIITLNTEFSLFIFKEIFEAFKGVAHHTLTSLLNVPLYTGQHSIYNGFRSKLIHGDDSSTFYRFLSMYFKLQNHTKINQYDMVILAPIMYSSLNFICKLTQQIIGINSLWVYINTYL
jgi:hypothetical protein